MKNEKDLDLKLRMMRFLWYNGYFTRRNVNLLRYTYGRKTGHQYTDIDVWGIQLDGIFNQHQIICDCKSGVTASTAERFFWLSGIMKYFNADQGIFLRTKVRESKYLDLGKKLQILPLSLDQLSELEKAYNIESKPFIGAFNRDIIEKEDVMFGILKEKAEPIYDYIQFKYWTDPVQQQIISLVNSEQKINNLSDITDEERLFLQMYILSHLSVSILKFSEPILVIPNKEKEFHVSERLMGGKMESAERRKLLETFYEFMVEEISKRYNEKYPITKRDFMSNYYPPYLKYFLDLVERICLKSRVAIHVPRMLDVITYELLLNKKDTNIIDQIFASDNLDLIEVYKLTKDFMTFGERSGFITKERNEYLKEKIYKAES